jgi:hypothetical protein
MGIETRETLQVQPTTLKAISPANSTSVVSKRNSLLFIAENWLIK